MGKFIIVQICGLLIVSLLTIMTLNRKRIYVRSVRAYTYALFSALVSLLLDILSVVCLWYSTSVLSLFVTVICKLYLISIVNIGFSAFNYLMAETYIVPKFLPWRSISLGFLFLSAATIFIAPISKHIEADSIYTYGTSVYITYICALTYCILTLLMTFYFKKIFNKNRLKYVRIWVLIWSIMAIIQFKYNDLLLVSFATALSLTILFCEIENPISYIDLESNLFNTKAIKSYTSEQYMKGGSVTGVCVKLHTFSKSLSLKESTEIIITISKYLQKLSFKTFRIDTYTFILLFEPDEVMDNFYKLQDYFENLENTLSAFNGVTVTYGIIKDEHIFDNLDDVINVYYYIKANTSQEIIFVNTDLLQTLKNYVNIKQEILDALSEDRVEVFYQPIYDTRINSYTSAEALCRIRNKDGSIMPPNVFIPIAEDSGLIVPLGERIFTLVCKFINENNIEQLGLNYIEVNLSLIQVEQTDLYDKFKHIMQTYNVLPNQINFEITESFKMSNSEEVIRTINNFIDMGFKFSLDDFGTGNSNLDYMLAMPINIVKFDYKITQKYFKDKKTEIMLGYIIPMIKTMGFEIVCEGVESELQFEKMTSLGIEHIQGFLLSKPISESEFKTFIMRENQKTL